MPSTTGWLSDLPVQRQCRLGDEFPCPQQRAEISDGARLFVTMGVHHDVLLCPQQRAGYSDVQPDEYAFPVETYRFYALNNGLGLATCGSVRGWFSEASCFYVLNSGLGLATLDPEPR